MPIRPHLIRPLLWLATLFSCTGVFASNGAGEGYLSVGLGYRASQSMFRDDESGPALYINGRYQWRGVFIEYSSIPQDTVALPTVGYNFFNTEHWFLDAVYAWTDGDFRFEGTFNGDYSNFNRDQSQSFGIRATGVYGANTLQLALLPLNNEAYDRGTYASAWIGRELQLANWTVRGLLGAQYRSAEIMDFYFGVDKDEATGFFPEYRADAGTRFSLLLEASRPLSRHLVLSSYISHTEFSQSAKNSPLNRFTTEFLGRPDNASEVGVVLNYVF